jgi:hypothetical protein
MTLSKEAYERLKKEQENMKNLGRRPLTRASRLSNSRGEKKLRELEEKLLQRA